jgi:hypothetical protein
MDNELVIWPIIVLAISTIFFIRSKIAIVDHFTVYNKVYPKCVTGIYKRHRKIWWLRKIMITSIMITLISFIGSVYVLLTLFIQLP